VNTPEQQAALVQLLEQHYDATAAWIDHTTNPPTLRILRKLSPIATAAGQRSITQTPNSGIPIALNHLPWDIQPAPPFLDLRLPLPTGGPLNFNQDCQDEPIQLGTQIQPAGAPWVGTAGLPVKWLDQAAKPHWGILSNWHVFCVNGAKKGHPQHQPTDARPAVALLTDWNGVTAQGTNYLDAAIADAYINGFHTISNQIIRIGRVGDHPIDATVGLPVVKSGRTTGRTNAKCSATGAAVKVSYGAFQAIFADQDVFEDENGHFSAPGDSGSSILGSACWCACALLFAGGGNLTIGNPIRYAIDRFKLVFPFN